jgi:hypothetical protein
VATACAAGAAVLVTGGVLLANTSPSPAQADSVSQPVRIGTTPVEKGDLRGTTVKTGELGGTSGATIPGGVAGTLTSIPDVGSVVKPGDALYRVDDQPVIFFSGTLPQWRAFEQGMTDGPDILQLEEVLHAQGYLDEVATSHFDWHTTRAIRAWQKATGQEQTGRIDLGRIWFGTGAQVVSEHSLHVGDRVSPGSPVYSTTGTTKVVVVDLPVGSPQAKLGGIADVHLPTGATLPGHVTMVGDPSSDDDGRTTVPVTVGFDDGAKVGDLDRVDVTVDFVTETRKQVLSVPVVALGAEAGGGFVVEVRSKSGTSRSVPVKTGLFAGDRVEVSGAIHSGDRVVVPE